VMPTFARVQRNALGDQLGLRVSRIVLRLSAVGASRLAESGALRIRLR